MQVGTKTGPKLVNNFFLTIFKEQFRIDMWFYWSICDYFKLILLPKHCLRC